MAVSVPFHTGDHAFVTGIVSGCYDDDFESSAAEVTEDEFYRERSGEEEGEGEGEETESGEISEVVEGSSSGGEDMEDEEGEIEEGVVEGEGEEVSTTDDPSLHTSSDPQRTPPTDSLSPSPPSPPSSKTLSAITERVKRLDPRYTHTHSLTPPGECM